MMNRALVIGGGISGLSAAYYLKQAGFRATVVEKSPTAGGVIRTERVGECLVEAGPDSFLAAKPWAMELIREVGLAGQVINSNDHLRITYVLKKGKLIPLPDGMMMMVPTQIFPLLSTRLLSWPAKIRMGLELLRRPAGPRPDRSIHDFLMDHYGQEAIDYLAEPLLAGVFGGDPKLLSVDSVLARFVELEAKYGSLSRGVLRAPKPKGTGSGGSLFRTLRGGLGQLVETLTPAADMVRGEALAIERSSCGFRVRVDGDWLETEQIFIGGPAYVAAKLLLPLDADLAGLLNSIPYNSSMTLSLGYDKSTFDHPLRGFGFLVPQRERKHLKACTWVNNKFDFRAPADKVLLRCFLGGDYLSESDEALVGMAREELRNIMGLEAKPVFHRIARWPHSMAQYTVGHKQRLDQIRSRMAALPGIFLGGNGFHGIGVPDCIHSGKEAAQNIAMQLGAVTSASA